MARHRVLTGCRDCTACTGNVFSGSGTHAGHTMLAVVTLGLSMLFIRKCKGCGHAMSLHPAAIMASPVVASAPIPPPVPPGMPPAVLNGNVWQAWNPQGNRWMVWNGQGWQ